MSSVGPRPSTRAREAETAALLAMLQNETESTHICGRCRTPFGRSALACPNDPARKG